MLSCTCTQAQHFAFVVSGPILSAVSRGASSDAVTCAGLMVRTFPALTLACALFFRCIHVMRWCILSLHIHGHRVDGCGAICLQIITSALLSCNCMDGWPLLDSMRACTASMSRAQRNVRLCALKLLGSIVAIAASIIHANPSALTELDRGLMYVEHRTLTVSAHVRGKADAKASFVLQAIVRA